MADIIFSEESNVNNSAFGEVQTPIRAMILEEVEAFEEQSMIGVLAREVNSTHRTESYHGMGSMDSFKPVGENGAYPVNGTSMIDGKEIKNITWKSGFSVSQEMIDDGMDFVIDSLVSDFSTAYNRTREEHLAALYGNAFAGNATFKNGDWTFDTKTRDGLTLFNTQHKQLKTGKTQSNKYQDAFSATVLAKIEAAMRDFKDENGHLVALHPNTILIPDDGAMLETVLGVIGADKNPTTTGSNAFNFHFGRWNVVTWHYLNDYITANTSPFAVLDTDYMFKKYCSVFQTREALHVTSKIKDNDANEWDGRTRFNAAFTDWRFIIGGGMTGGSSL